MINPQEYPQIVENILTNCITIPQTYKADILEKKDRKSYSSIVRKLIFDKRSKNYLVIVYGYEAPIVTGNRATFNPIRSCVVHLEITDKIIKVYQDKLEDSITNELIEAGIDKEQILILHSDKQNCVNYVVNSRQIYYRYRNYFTTDSNYQNPILKPNLTLAELDRLKKIDLEPINKAIALYEEKR